MVIERGRLVAAGLGPALLWRGQTILGRGVGACPWREMEDTVAYADNWSDRALLEQVGRAVVVRPRGRLLRLARAGAGTSSGPNGRPRRNHLIDSGVKPMNAASSTRVPSCDADRVELDRRAETS